MGTYVDENGDLVTYDLTTGDVISTQPGGSFATDPSAVQPTIPPVGADPNASAISPGEPPPPTGGQTGVGPDPSKRLSITHPIIQGPNGGFFYQYADGSYSPFQSPQKDLNALQQAELAKAQAQTNRILAGGQSAAAGAALAGHQLTAQGAANALAEQHRQFDENLGYEKAKFNENYALDQGKTLLGLGSRPDTLIKYLYALKGLQTPQAVAGTTNNLPGFGNLATTPGPTAQTGPAPVAQAPAQTPVAQAPAAAPNAGLQTSPGTQQQLISQELARAGASPQTFASNNLTIPGTGPVNNSAGAQVAHSQFSNPATGQTVSVAGGGALPSTFEWSAPLTPEQQARNTLAGDLRENRSYAAGGEIGYDPQDRIDRVADRQLVPPSFFSPRRPLPTAPIGSESPNLSPYAPVQDTGLGSTLMPLEPSGFATTSPISAWMGGSNTSPNLSPYPLGGSPRISPNPSPYQMGGSPTISPNLSPYGLKPTLPGAQQDTGLGTTLMPVGALPNPGSQSPETPGERDTAREARGQFFRGGVVPEPVVGIGLHSGQTYTFGEKGPEGVVPTNRLPKDLRGPRHYDTGGPIGQPSDQPPGTGGNFATPPTGPDNDPQNFLGPTLLPPGADTPPPIAAPTGAADQGARSDQARADLPAPSISDVTAPVDEVPGADRGIGSPEHLAALLAADIVGRQMQHAEPTSGFIPFTPTGRLGQLGDRRRLNQFALGGAIGYNPSSSTSSGFFNDPNLSSVVQRGYNSNPNVPLFPQIDYATGGGQSLIASSQRLNNLLPSEQQVYAGTLQDEFGAQPQDVFALARKLAPQVSGLHTPRFAG